MTESASPACALASTMVAATRFASSLSRTALVAAAIESGAPFSV